MIYVSHIVNFAILYYSETYVFIGEFFLLVPYPMDDFFDDFVVEESYVFGLYGV
jgi:hypothetical protein